MLYQILNNRYKVPVIKVIVKSYTIALLHRTLEISNWGAPDPLFCRSRLNPVYDITIITYVSNKISLIYQISFRISLLILPPGYKKISILFSYRVMSVLFLLNISLLFQRPTIWWYIWNLEVKWVSCGDTYHNKVFFCINTRRYVF